MKQSIKIIVIITILVSSIISCNQKKDNKYRLNGIYQTAKNGLEIKFYNDSTKSLKIDTIPVINYSDIDKIEKQYQSQTNQSIINLQLTEIGKKKFKKATRENLNKPLAIVLNDKLLSAPTIVSVIPNGQINISGIDNDQIDKILGDFRK